MEVSDWPSPVLALCTLQLGMCAFDRSRLSVVGLMRSLVLCFLYSYDQASRLAVGSVLRGYVLPARVL